MRAPLVAGLVLAIAALSASTPAFAQSDHRARQRAAQRFGEGVSAYDLGEYAVACDAFDEATRLTPGAFGPWMGLALCSEQLRRFGTADRSCDQALVLLAQKSGAPARAQEQRCRELKIRIADLVPTLIVQRPLSVRAADVQVKVDDELFGPSDIVNPLRLDPGRHMVVILVKGTPYVTHQLKVRAGQAIAVAVPEAVAKPETREQRSPGRGPGAPPVSVSYPGLSRERLQTQQSTREENARKRMAGAVTMGVGGGVLLIGLTLHAAAETTDIDCDLFDESCGDGDNLRTAAYATYVIGAAAVGIGAVMLFSNLKDPDATGTRTTVAPVIGADHIGLAIGGRF